MFILTKISDLVQITPEDFSKPSKQAIEDNINAKYANKVIQKIGLCICLYDLLSSSEGLIGHGTGLVNVNVEFRLVVFRPFREKSSTAASPPPPPKESTCAPPSSLTFSSPPPLFPPARVFIYRHPHIPDLMHFDTYEMARFRIEEEEWIDQTPEKPESDTAMDEEERRARRLSPWRIIASMADDGLGPCFWWDEDEESEE
ncbi:hypothetical protein VE04_08269 [Pseudogymnoascus sp. 24MN13]|nr:hypothetical protein VE04_08269 [Pseudogymnoascus sp. 24MN13]